MHETINNAHGTEIDFNAAVNLMDDDIRERLYVDLPRCTATQFFEAYCAAHRERFGEEFEPNKLNPVW